MINFDQHLPTFIILKTDTVTDTFITTPTRTIFTLPPILHHQITKNMW